MKLLNNQIYMAVDHSEIGMCGQLLHSSFHEPVEFSGIEQLLKLMDYLMTKEKRRLLFLFCIVRMQPGKGR